LRLKKGVSFARETKSKTTLTNPSISIIIPTFNSETTLEDCLDSVLGQTYDNFEIIIQDGKSTDGTVKIIERFANTSKVISYSSENDSGVYNAMNKGIDIAKGNWLYFLGSDDTLHDKNVLTDMSEHLESESADIVYGDVILSGRNTRFGGEFDVLRLHRVENLCHQSVFYHKSVFEKLGKYNLLYKVNADWDFNIRCFRHPELKKKYIPRLIAVYNEVTGLSGRFKDEALYKELPVAYFHKIRPIELELEDLKNSREYILGKQIYRGMKKVGLISLLKKFKKKP
jgi:glycosyltransferase involved in cell wall biosynthesis